MSWSKSRGAIHGPIGDPLAIHLVAPFPVGSGVNFVNHTWLAQVRKKLLSPVVVTTFVITEDLSGPDLIDILLTLDDTSVFEDNVKYVWGVKAITGAHAPFTLVAESPINPYGVVPRIPVP
jgi:hypothetical protein